MLLTVRSTPDACVFSRPAPTARPLCWAQPPSQCPHQPKPRPLQRKLRRGPKQHIFLWPRGQRHLILTPLLQLRPDHAAVDVIVRVLWGRRERKIFFLPLHPYQVVRLAVFIAPLPRRLLCILPLLMLLLPHLVGRVGPRCERIRAIGARLHLWLPSPRLSTVSRRD
jgi:hypothetical protein